VQKALAHFEKTAGKNSPLYLGAEIAYAHMLRHRGMKKEAAVLEERAENFAAGALPATVRGVRGECVELSVKIPGSSWRTEGGRT
jgi:hypothetical protein